MFFKPFELPVPPTFRNVCYDIRNFGAVEGKETKNTEAVKKAIETSIPERRMAYRSDTSS